MSERPTTLAEARRYRYGAWAGNPKGNAYREGFCVAVVWPNERGAISRQCGARHQGKSPFCAIHAPGAREERAAKRPPTKFQRELALLEQERRERNHLKRCERALRAISRLSCTCTAADCPISIARKVVR